MVSDMKEMVNQALQDVLLYPERSAAWHVKRGLKKVMGQSVEHKDKINWPTALLAIALMDYYHTHLNSEEAGTIIKTLRKYYDRWIAGDKKIYYLDDILCGMALIDLEQVTGEEKYRAALDTMVQYLERHERDGAGSLPYRPEQKNNHIYADSIGMICPFLCKYAKTYEKGNVSALAIRQIQNFVMYGMDEKTGLPYHGYEYEKGIKHGIIGWGRAAGWLMMGMVESLIYLDKEKSEYDGIKQAFRRLVDKVEMYQLGNGMYAWQLEAREGCVDSSATAMILLAIARGLKSEILIGIHRSRMLRGREGLKQYVEAGRVDHALAECQGFAMYPQIYGSYPWSLGPALSLLAVTEDIQ